MYEQPLPRLFVPQCLCARAKHPFGAESHGDSNQCYESYTPMQYQVAGLSPLCSIYTNDQLHLKQDFPFLFPSFLLVRSRWASWLQMLYNGVPPHNTRMANAWPTHSSLLQFIAAVGQRSVACIRGVRYVTQRVQSYTEQS